MDHDLKKQIAHAMASMKPPKVSNPYFLNHTDDISVGKVVAYPPSISHSDQQKFICYAPDGLEPKLRLRVPGEETPTVTPVWMVMPWGPMTDAEWFQPIMETLHAHGIEVVDRVACTPEVLEYLHNMHTAQRIDEAIDCPSQERARKI